MLFTPKLPILLMFLIFSTALVACGGGGATSTTYTTTTTLGQELSDLKRAKEEGVITEQEYETARKKILNRYDN